MNNIRQRIALIHIRWNKGEISGDEAMRQIAFLAKKECNKAWLTDQGMKSK